MVRRRKTRTGAGKATRFVKRDIRPRRLGVVVGVRSSAHRRRKSWYCWVCGG